MQRLYVDRKKRDVREWRWREDMNRNIEINNWKKVGSHAVIISLDWYAKSLKSLQGLKQQTGTGLLPSL